MIDSEDQEFHSGMGSTLLSGFGRGHGCTLGCGDSEKAGDCFSFSDVNEYGRGMRHLEDVWFGYGVTAGSGYSNGTGKDHD